MSSGRIGFPVAIRQETTSSPPCWRTQGMLSLPTPARGGDLRVLRPFLNIATDNYAKNSETRSLPISDVLTETLKVIRIHGAPMAPVF